MNPTWFPWDDPAVLHQGYQTRVGHARIRVYQDNTDQVEPDRKHIMGFIPGGPVLFQGTVRGDWDEAKALALKGWEKARDQGGRP